MTEKLNRYMALDEIPIKLNSDRKLLEYIQKLIDLHNKLVAELEPSRANFVLEMTRLRLGGIHQAIRLYNLSEIKLIYSGIYIDYIDFEVDFKKGFYNEIIKRAN